jgi:arabinose-5-phosphate isomerase
MSATLKEIIIEISSKRLGATAVLDNSGILTGIITDGDLRRMLSNFENLTGITAADIMTPSPLTIDCEEYAVEALVTMQKKNITQLIVTKGGSFTGFVHLHDLLKEGLV